MSIQPSHNKSDDHHTRQSIRRETVKRDKDSSHVSLESKPHAPEDSMIKEVIGGQRNKVDLEKVKIDLSEEDSLRQNLLEIKSNIEGKKQVRMETMSNNASR